MNRAAVAGVVAGAVAVVLVAGSWWYRRASGEPGTPADFRERVAETGLDLDWKRNGRTGGDGTLITGCDERPVTVRELDGDLYLLDGDTMVRLTQDRMDDLLACADG